MKSAYVLGTNVASSSSEEVSPFASPSPTPGLCPWILARHKRQGSTFSTFPILGQSFTRSVQKVSSHVIWKRDIY